MTDTVEAPAEPEISSAIIYRELLPEEWGRLAAVEGFNEHGVPPITNSRMMIAEDPATGAIVGYWMIFEAVHIEPMWIHENFRRHRGKGVLFNLWKQVQGALQDISSRYGLGACYAHILDDNPYAAVLAQRLGFRKIPGDLYYVPILPAGAPTPPEEP